MPAGKREFTSLRIKTARFIALIFIITALMIYLILNTMMMDAINILERRYVTEHVERAVGALNAEVDRLTYIAFDWAIWDDTYDFISDPKSDYVANNLGPATFSNLKLNTMVYINEYGDFIYQGALDGASGEIVPAPPEFIEYIKTTPILYNTDPGYKPAGLIMLPEGPMLIASSPILKSDASGPVHGNLVVGRYLDQALTSMLAAQLRLNLEIEPLEETAIGDSDIGKGPTVRTPLTVEEISASSIAGYALVPDIKGVPAVKLSVVMDRDISAIGRDTIRIVLILLMAVFFIFTFLILVFLNRSVLSRLLDLSRNLRVIGRDTGFAARLHPQTDHDELAILTDEINSMMDELETSQKQVRASEQALKDANEELEMKVELRTTELSMANDMLEAEIRARAEIQDKVKHLAYHDHLTDLPNRLLMTEHINHSIDVACRVGNKLAVLFLDLDGFKMINDTLGHTAGDILLREVAGRLIQAIRKSDIVARIGGDEFIILVENLDNTGDINLVGDKILHCFDQPFIIDGQEIFVTTSIGAAMFPEDGRDGGALIKNADIAMYKAKEQGKNRCVICSPGMKTSLGETMLLANTLHRSLERGELELYYQPQVNCASGRISSVEALLRWNHPELGLLPPEKFIPLAEQSGLIVPIGEWVLRNACRQNMMWREAGYTDIRMAVNLSVKQFQSRQLVPQILDILQETGMDPESLELEVTENIAMKEKNLFVPILSALREAGIHIAIDDFGTEYSSLHYLTHLPIDRVKIAMPFVQGIAVNEKDEAIVNAILLLARNMGLGVIAEGVETEEQFTFLHERQCDEVQGFYFYRPMPAVNIQELLQNPGATG